MGIIRHSLIKDLRAEITMLMEIQVFRKIYQYVMVYSVV